MKDASKSLIRKMNEFRAEEEPGWEAPPEMQPVYAPEPDDDTQEDSENGPGGRDPITEPLAEEDSERPQNASHAPIREAQVIQRSLDAMEVRLAVDRKLTDAELAEVRRAILHGLHDRNFALDFVFMDAIPRSQAGKFEAFRCEIP